jgi:hypothetical protein
MPSSFSSSRPKSASFRILDHKPEKKEKNNKPDGRWVWILRDQKVFHHVNCKTVLDIQKNLSNATRAREVSSLNRGYKHCQLGCCRVLWTM